MSTQSVSDVQRIARVLACLKLTAIDGSTTYVQQDDAKAMVNMRINGKSLEEWVDWIDGTLPRTVPMTPGPVQRMDDIQPGLERAAAYLRKKACDRLRDFGTGKEPGLTDVSMARLYAGLAAEIEALTQRPAVSDNVGEEK